MKPRERRRWQSSTTAFGPASLANARISSGLAVQINGAPATIVGVMPDGLDFPTQGDLWMPVAHTPALLQRGLTPRGFMVFGRLRDGASLEDARTELATINRRLEAEYPATNRNVFTKS